ncbi:lysylphosphatidylglycerol synthase transmembrane domain-containing protein [Trueperella bialowiezensis]|uniref:Flippase-like domain-containing protein n=1 Tax=Trueperella bialowiezensis TaxID=312285 RepID=A0A3S4V719_9ACTO|nr:lysylphosphatidylglycerol synthase transmembrane domain-containing protein [Trueperella bialowiezensis]VEI13452.1 Uncharacterised protein family (UPF0104) [Trueperella bialowiezensis]
MTSQIQTPRRRVLLIDSPQRWARNPADLFGAVLAVLGAVLLAFVAVYAQTTTFAIAADVRRATGGVLETLLALPINVLEGLMSFFLPFALIAEMIVRRRWRTLATAAVAAGVSAVVTNVVVWAGEHWWPTSRFIDQLSTAIEQQSHIALVPYVAVVAAILAVSGSAKGSRITRTGWWLLAIVLVFSVIQGNQTLTAALLTVFVGLACGLATRYVIGGEPERTTGADLVTMIRRAGLDPVTIIRIDDLTSDDPLYAYHIDSAAPLGHTNMAGLEQIRQIIQASPTDNEVTSEAENLIRELEDLAKRDDLGEINGLDAEMFRQEARAKYPATRSSLVSRNYIATDDDERAFHVKALDADRQVISFLDDLWARLTLRTTFRQTRSTTAAMAEQMVLISMRAEKVGIDSPKLVGLARMESSIVLIEPASTEPFIDDVPADDISDADLDSLWDQLRLAHRAGMSHGNMHAKYVKVTDDGLRVTAWHHGSVLSTDAARQVDLAQTVAMLASTVGVDRAVASLQRALPAPIVASIAPFLQRTILPRYTKDAFSKKDLQALRDALAQDIPEATNFQDVEFKRFSPKTIITVTIGVVAVVALLGSLNFDDLRTAIANANPWWMVAAFLVGLGTYVGAAISLKAYTQENLPFGETLAVQVAASVVTLVAPAGIGPAALNLRFLHRKGVPTTPAVATVTITQIAQFLVTIILLLVLSLLTGDLGNLSLPSGSVMIAIGVVIAAIAIMFVIKPIRDWVLGKIRPTLQQIWPRMVWLVTHPTRILLGAGGAVFQSAAFIATFGMSLKAFGYELPLVTLAITYLLSNSVGSVVPSPGGIGPVEAALTGGLVIAGIPSSIAFSTAVLYRLFTFWGRVPLGWIVLRVIQKRNIV